VAVLRIALRQRPQALPLAQVIAVALVVVVVGMSFAKWGANVGLVWPVYYGVPAAVTLLLPPIVFRMQLSEFAQYLILAALISPIIHVAFSFLFGWKERNTCRSGRCPLSGSYLLQAPNHAPAADR